MIEIWKDILGYEGLYQASNLGRIKSVDRTKIGKSGCEVIWKGRILHQYSNNGNNTYLKVRLSKDGVIKNHYVHRLVWEAFNGKIPELMQVNHIDENCHNNLLSNLNLMTSKENNNWGTHTERLVEKQLNNAVNSKIVFQFDLNGNFIREWPSGKEIQRQLNIPQANISACCLGKMKQSHSYIWKYKKDCQN